MIKGAADLSSQMSSIHIGSNGEFEPVKLNSSASFKARSKKVGAGVTSRAGSEVDDFITLLHGSDPVRVELNRLDNEVRGFSLSLSRVE